MVSPVLADGEIPAMDGSSPPGTSTVTGVLQEFDAEALAAVKRPVLTCR